MGVLHCVHITWNEPLQGIYMYLPTMSLPLHFAFCRGRRMTLPQPSGSYQFTFVLLPTGAFGGYHGISVFVGQSLAQGNSMQFLVLK